MAQLLLAHVDLVVRDVSRSLEYYCKKLGFNLLEDTIVSGELPRFLSGGVSDAMRLVLIRSSRIGAAVELLEFVGQSANTNEPEAPWFRNNVSFTVDDLEGLMEGLREKGETPYSPAFTVGLTQSGHSRIVLYRDPDGHVLEFIQKT